ncbi:MAG: tRNA modification GTPase MnmE [Chitinophagales bacterium]|nr:MAG: tRNA modification GTPase MnmE [Chitinophagales bacterium]
MPAGSSCQRMYKEDTIVALSTPPGVSAIGVIRLSGPEAIAIAESVFRGKKLSQQPSHTLHHGWIIDGKSEVDEVVIGLFRAPHSYTGEDVVEISAHGSPFVLQKIIHVLVDRGARPAEPGEFTKRAFLHGRMDLTQAEAVADLIAASSEAAHRNALQHLRGGFSRNIQMLKDKLVDFASLVELELDFSEEDVEFADRGQLRHLVTELKAEIAHLLESFRLGNAVTQGISVVIAGQPNAGKSTLLNRLLNDERAIVSDIPGTTRDTIEECIQIEGILFRLIDTAGLREAGDTVERLGIERTLTKAHSSAILVYLFDVNTATAEQIKKDLSVLRHPQTALVLAGNKIDQQSDVPAGFDVEGAEIIWLSSKTGQNVEKLKSALVSKVSDLIFRPDDTLVTNVRHYEALKKALEALDEVLQGLEGATSGELLALDIRRALDALAAITGQISSEDVLNAIFSRFCIGK